LKGVECVCIVRPMTRAPQQPKQALLAQPVTALRGVGAERALQLARLKIQTVEELLLHGPRRYEDRRHFRPIAELKLDEAATSRGSVVACGLKRFRHGRKSVFELILDDGTARLHCRWWNLPFMEKYFRVGDEVVVYGKPLSLRPRTMDHPETEVTEPGEEHFIHFNRITPIYPLTEGLPQRWLRGLMWRALGEVVEPAREGACILPEWQSADEKLAVAPAETRAFPSRANAVHMLHFPEAWDDIEMARRRLALDEYVDLQGQMQRRRLLFQSRSRGLPCGGDNRLIKPFLDALGFRLTSAQTQVLREIRQDMRGAFPMRRLLQGDVGSGKTVVAACTALMAMESGFNVVLMAPTEILAEQHYRNFKNWFAPLNLAVELQTGSQKSATTQIQVRQLVIGTHAVLTAGFELPKLGLVIIDEQHKFGVAQREQLVRKGVYPHLLVMTATPIPRTLGLTLYGELDCSVIDALPSGRGRIRTYVRAAETLPRVWEFIREQLKAGRQAFVVYPRVSESVGTEVKAVTREFDQVSRHLAPYQVGLLHGRLKAAAKEQVMAAFRSNQIQVLLATSLIEVGVDVPNATIMVIENAEQFGLAQLHQLRGRIGRGAHESYCILVSGEKSGEARDRLQVLETSADGFAIAEADLKLRGPGEMLGQQQSGMPRFRFGDLAQDLELIRLAQRLARMDGR
jgi:ATP-dependent DNA helicase RecG